MSFGRDGGTARDRGASPESGHLASPLWLYQRMVAPFLVHRGLSATLKGKKTHSLPMMLHSEKTYSVKPQREGIEEQCLTVCFLSLYKLKRSAYVTSMWTLWISSETLVCRWMYRTIPQLTYKGKELFVWDWQYQDTRTHGAGSERFFRSAIKQSKTGSWEGWLVFFTSVCFVRCAVVNASSALFSSDPTSRPLHRTVCCALSCRGL